MAVTVPNNRGLRHPAMARAEERQPGPWWWRAEARAATTRPVWFCCPSGHVGQLDHEVAADGAVTSSVECPEEGCTFHDNLSLSGWEP